MRFILFLIPIFLFAHTITRMDPCWWNIAGNPAGGSWSSCHHCDGKPMCGPESWGCEPHSCGDGKVWLFINGTCNCIEQDFCPPYMKRDRAGHCIPNPDLTPEQCAHEGGTYVDCSSFADTFSSRNNAFACLIGNSGCYSPTWIEVKRNKWADKFKQIVTPKRVIETAIMLAPISKIFKIPVMLDSLFNVFRRAGGNLKMLEDNKPIIDLKYNPESGVFEPDVTYTPRQQPLAPERLLTPPKNSTEAKDIIDTAPDLENFLESRFADIQPADAEELTNERIAYDIDTEPQAKTKIADDLREIFKRSAQPQKENYPVPIKPDIPKTPKIFQLPIPDIASPTGQIETTVTRKVKPLTGNRYQIIYNVKPQGASKPVTIVYDATVTGHDVQLTPKYKIGDNKYVQGRQGELYNQKNNIVRPLPVPLPNPISNPTSQPQPVGGNTYITNNYYNNYYNTEKKEENNSVPDVTTAKNPIEKAITTAFAYKITLFSCPEVTPKCPNDLNISMFGGHLTIPDPVCAVINAMNKPEISGKVDWAGNIIVIVATIAGLLTLFKRD